MQPTQTLVPNLKSRILVILAVIVVGTIGLFERRTRFTLHDGTVFTGKVVTRTADDVAIELPSKTVMHLAPDRIAQEQWFHVDVDLTLGLDLKGGTALRYRIDMSEVAAEERADLLERTIETFKSRLDTFGVKEMSIRAAGQDEISIELPGVTMEESLAYEQLVQSLGRLEFRIVAQSKPGVLNVQEERERLQAHLDELSETQPDWTPKGVDLSSFDVRGAGGVTYRWFPYAEKTLRDNPSMRQFPFELLELDPKYDFSGEDVERTYPSVDERGFAALGFEIKGARASDFGDFTETHVNRPMAILLDHEISGAPPVLNSRIERHGQISGGIDGFDSDELKSLRTVLSSGSLRVRPEKLSKATIGPTLGEASIRRGVIAGSCGGLFVFLFMLVFYRSIGTIACLTLLLGIYLLLGALGFLGATLTLPGIAGIVLTIGMAVDQNILINERIREERDKGKTLAQAIKNGFERAFITIFDAQMTTFLAGAILYKFGTGPIKGFAVTLMLGIVTTMFAAITGSKVLFALGLARGWFKTLSMMRMVGETKIDFMRWMKPALAASALCIAAGLTVLALHYREIEGLDFAGGFQAHVRLAEPMTQPELLALVRSVPENATAQVVSMRGVEGDEGVASRGEGVRDFLITIRASSESENEEGGEADDPREYYLRNLLQAIGDRLLPEGVTDLELTPDPETQRTDLSFGLNFAQPVARDVVEGRLRDALAVTDVAPVGTEPTAVWRVRATSPGQVKPAGVRASISTSLVNLPDGNRLSDPIPESQFIGSSVGKRLANDAIKAIVLAIIGILIYIRIRFHDFRWGLAACVACFHNVLFVLGAVAVSSWLGLVNVELDLAMIGAFLTIVGYSLNDTIVIFDRVRENLPRINRPLIEVVNVSVNQTLARTLLTGLSLLVALAILFGINYGQHNVLEGFSFAMFIGIIAGTYSTVYIASPLMVWMTNRAKRSGGSSGSAEPKKVAATT